MSRFGQIFLIVYAIGLGIFALVYAFLYTDWRRNLADLLPPKMLSISGIFGAITPAGFKMEYVLTLSCSRIEMARLRRPRIAGAAARAAIVDDFQSELFTPLFSKELYFFSLSPRSSSLCGRPLAEVPHATLHGLSEDHKVWNCPPPYTVLRSELKRLRPFERKGCQIAFENIDLPPMRAELVEENYTMLTDRQKELIESDPRFCVLEEALAIAALKRRRDLLDNGGQRHETEELIIETLRAGRGFKITWRFKKESGKTYELLGFRTTGGFFHDKWNETHNGALVVHSHIDGNVVEFLKEGEPTFYTFFLRERETSRNREPKRCSSVRFQVTIASKDELEEIQKVIDRTGEAKPSDPRMTELLKELDLMMEFQDAMDGMERSLIEKVRAKKLSKDDREEKLAFVRDMVRLQREKYQP